MIIIVFIILTPIIKWFVILYIDDHKDLAQYARNENIHSTPQWVIWVPTHEIKHGEEIYTSTLYG